MRSCECVTGSRLPSSSIFDPVSSSISSSTRTFTRPCTRTSRPLARDAEHQLVRLLATAALAHLEPVDHRVGCTDEHLRGHAARLGVGGEAAQRSGRGTDRVADLSEHAADVATDHAAREHRPGHAARHELSDLADRVVDTVVVKRRLHGRDHVLLGHARTVATASTASSVGRIDTRRDVRRVWRSSDRSTWLDVPP